MSTLDAVSPPRSELLQQPKRWMAIDALRGFAMFWIIGAGGLAHALVNISGNSFAQTVGTQLEHVQWEGFRFYDLIFPLFVFLVGASLVFSLDRIVAESSRAEAAKRVVRRGMLLVVIGIFYYGGFSNVWPEIRLAGVLQRLGLCYLFAGLAYLIFGPRQLVFLCAGVLVGYWALMTWVPFPDLRLEEKPIEQLSIQAGSSDPAALVQATPGRINGVYEKGYNLANYIDWRFLPGKKHNRYYDPEGILSTLPAIATCLLGTFAGLLLKNPRFTGRQKTRFLITAGAAGILAGFLWGLQFPVIKNIWTSSFVLVAGGFSSLLLGCFSLVIDEWNYRTWCKPLLWIGMNSITIYLAANLVGFGKLATRFVGGDVRQWFEVNVTPGFGDLVIALLGLAIALAFVRFLYQRKIFLRI